MHFFIVLVSEVDALKHKSVIQSLLTITEDSLYKKKPSDIFDW